MTWKKRTATAASTMLLAAAGMMATASPAAADGPCPANRLCIWDQTGFSGNRIITGSTNACYVMGEYTFGSVRSYDNNLPVKAEILRHYFTTTGGHEWIPERTLVSGGFSSNIGELSVGDSPYDRLCMGGARP